MSMVANYFLGAVILTLITDIAFGTDVCLCPADIFRFLPDCCSIPSHTTKIWTTQKPLLDTSWTTRMVWYVKTTTKKLIWKRSVTRILPNMENLTSNPEMNLNVSRTGTYAYGESVIEGWPPSYTLASLCQPIAPPPYTMGSHSEHVVLVAPPPYTPTSPSVPPPPYSEYI
ncbi:hypothetical protein ACJMK2_016091 [Sinanodonta woodiana]|uniref:Uncharacterized protein n=1 Tax=Sinanodonta woodiana TaxID=1069815 RepID=A0ABD3UW67_SINWO